MRTHERVLCPATASDQASSLSSIGQKIASGDFKSHPSPCSLKHHDRLCAMTISDMQAGMYWTSVISDGSDCHMIELFIHLDRF